MGTKSIMTLKKPKPQPLQNLTRTARDILEYLWSLSSKGKKTVAPIQAELAEGFCCSRRTVRRCLSELQKKGYIFPTKRNEFMIVHWTVSLTPKFLGKTIKTLPMVKNASQSIE